MKIQEQFKAARRVSTPLICILTQDPTGTINWIKEAINGETPCLSWDIISGLVPLGPQGKDTFENLGVDSSSTINPSETLSIVQNLPPKSVIFFKNAHRFLEPTRDGSESISQGVWNLRDEFKTNRRTLILLAPEINLPAELRQDILILEEELPNDQELEKIILGQYKSVRANYPDFPNPDEKTLTSTTDALRGLSGFSAEQVTAMSLTKEGINLETLWEKKRRTIEITPGLSVWRGKERFSDIGGVENIKSFLKAIMQGRNAPRALVMIDEIEKALAGAGTDSSGVSQDFLGQLLTYMQDKEACGTIFVGPAGTSKSLIVKAAGNEGGIPTIQLDLGGMKGSLVGASEANIRQALRVISAVAGEGGALFCATSNKIADLPVELRRRFSLGTYFFDLPSKEEREKIWDLYLKKYSLSGEIPSCEGWTGAEIKNCCDIAWRLDCSLKEAAQRIVPVCKSAAGIIKSLREQANGVYISASHPGPYQMGIKQETRAIELE